MDKEKETQNKEVELVCVFQHKDGYCIVFKRQCFYKKSGCAARIAE